MATKHGIFLTDGDEVVWGETMRRVRALWPEWKSEINEEQAKLWREHAATLDQQTLNAAVTKHRLESRARVPHLGAIIGAYRALRQDTAAPRQGRPSKPIAGIIDNDQWFDEQGVIWSKRAVESEILDDLLRIPSDECAAWRDSLVAHYADAPIASAPRKPEAPTPEQEIQHLRDMETWRRARDDARLRPSPWMARLRHIAGIDDPRQWGPFLRGLIWTWARRHGAFE